MIYIVSFDVRYFISVKFTKGKVTDSNYLEGICFVIFSYISFFVDHLEARLYLRNLYELYLNWLFVYYFFIECLQTIIFYSVLRLLFYVVKI